MRTLLSLVALAAPAALACRTTPVPDVAVTATASTTAGADSLRGIIAVEGSDPFTRVVLRAGGESVLLDDAPRALSSLPGADVRLHGSRIDGRRFRVVGFVVRGVGGRPAFDGLLTSASSGGGYALVLPDSARRAVRGAPPRFADLLGHRLWIVEDEGGHVGRYGVISSPGTPP